MEVMEPVQLCIPVADPSQVGEVRRAVSRVAQALALSASRRHDASIVATELATNLVRHARDGRILLQAIPWGASSGWLELLSVDGGPGMTDVQRCMQDGYSTVGTPGNGLGAVKRLSDEFDVHSAPGTGTVVASRIATSTAPANVFAVGAVCLPFPGEQVCGDTWRSIERDREIAVVVADGLGHGPEAATAARLAREVFESEPFAAPDRFYQSAHRSLTGSRGAALARAIIGATSEVQYSGIGNISGSVVGVDRSRGLASQNGTVGVQVRSQVSVFSQVMPVPGVLLMHSDGITSRWSFDHYPGLLVRHPAVIAGVLGRDFLRGRDDATMLVVSRARKVDAGV
jgi:anti-sigma regulatory factor (Ser/Thr protein kinase)